MSEKAVSGIDEAVATRILADLWGAFTDSDPLGDVFTRSMESAGLIHIRRVEASDLESSFAEERGIYPGGMIWELTDKGRAMLGAVR